MANPRISSAVARVIEALELRHMLSTAAPISLVAADPVGAPVGAPVEAVTPVLQRLSAAPAEARFWRPVSKPAARIAASADITVRSYAPLNVSLSGIRAALKSTPMQYTAAAARPLAFSVPTPDGSYERFNLVESQVMAPELAAKFPDIKTYVGVGIDDPSASLWLDVTPLGVHAQVLAGARTYYVDPISRQSNTALMSHYRSDGVMSADEAAWRCAVDEVDHQGLVDHDAIELDGTGGSAPVGLLTVSGATLRTYRLAVAATAEYTAFFGGTVALGQAAIVTAINRISGIYQTQLAIRMQLVGNNSSLVYTNSVTDPYTNSTPSTMLGENQANIDLVIGSSNYDVGHVFGGANTGGVAGLGVVGSAGNKARGVTGLSSPVGDRFWVDYTSHEFGHQFGANHSFNTISGQCNGNRNGSTAIEPGAGSTIMSYSDKCSPDQVQSSSDAYFNNRTLDEITTYTASGNGFNSAVKTASGNTPPTINGGADYTIPANTPFVLTATGSDPDAGQTLTYAWEQRDIGAAATLAAGDLGSGPLFRTFFGTTDPTRTFPRMSSLIANTSSLGEILPTTGRTLNFRVVARDNDVTSGAFNTDDVVITSIGGTSFAVTAPNTATSFTANTSPTFTWTVGGTTANSINTANVKISLSVDGGSTYPYVLAASTPNDGTQVVSLAGVPATTTACVKIEAVGNIFFDISNVNFTILAASVAPGTPTLDAASDTGISNSDRITRLNNNSLANRLSFTVPGTVAGATIRVLSNGVQIGTAVASGSTTTVLTSGAVNITDGSRNITATQQESGKALSTASAALSITIDTSAPQLSGSLVATPVVNGPLTSLPFAFGETVYGVSTAALRLVLGNGGNLLGGGQTVSGSGTAYALNGLATVAADPGNYTFSLVAAGAGITDAAGNAIAADASGPIAVDTINGGFGADVIRIFGTANPDVVNIFVNNNGANPNYTWTLPASRKLLVFGNEADDTVEVNGPASTDIYFDGGAGNDTFNLVSGAYTLRQPLDVENVTVSYNTSLTIASLHTNWIPFTPTVGDPTNGDLNDYNFALRANNLYVAGLLTIAASAGRPAATGGTPNTVLVSNLVIDKTPTRFTGTIDLNDNTLIYQGGGSVGFDLLYSALRQGYNFDGSSFGDWVSDGGILSGTAATDAQAVGARTLAVIRNSYPGPTPDPIYTVFAGQPVTADDVFVKYTYFGDTDLNGSVNGDDYTNLTSAIGAAGTGRGAFNADFNFTNGITDIGLAYTQITTAIGAQGGAGGCTLRPTEVVAVAAPLIVSPLRTPAPAAGPASLFSDSPVSDPLGRHRSGPLDA